MKTVTLTIIMLMCCGCTTGHQVDHWNHVAVAMTKGDVHHLMGEPNSVFSRGDYDLKSPEGMLVLSSAMLSQFESVEVWDNPTRLNQSLKVFFGKTGKVLGKLPHSIR